MTVYRATLRRVKRNGRNAFAFGTRHAHDDDAFGSRHACVLDRADSPVLCVLTSFAPFGRVRDGFSEEKCLLAGSPDKLFHAINALYDYVFKLRFVAHPVVEVLRFLKINVRHYNTLL
jgi:hypothetical protein